MGHRISSLGRFREILLTLTCRSRWLRDHGAAQATCRLLFRQSGKNSRNGFNPFIFRSVPVAKRQISQMTLAVKRKTLPRSKSGIPLITIHVRVCAHTREEMTHLYGLQTWIAMPTSHHLHRPPNMLFHPRYWMRCQQGNLAFRRKECHHVNSPKLKDNMKHW